MEWIAAAIGIADAAFGIFGSKDQKKLDQQRVQLGYEDNLEKIRRREFDQNTIQGAAKAFSENSGVLHTEGSTAQGFLDTMASEFEKEISWMQKYADEARRLGMEGASVDYHANILNSVTGGLKTGMSVYESIK